MPALGLSAVPEPTKIRMKSATGLTVAAALAEATAAPTGTVLAPRLIASDGLLRATPPMSRRTRFATATDRGESDTPTDAPTDDTGA
jgi:hypothetical protein